MKVELKAKEACSNCGKAAASIERGDFDLTQFGVPVRLKGFNLIKCAECGHVDPIIPDMDTMMKLAAYHVVLKRSPLSGREVRFLRKYVGKSARELAALLHVDHTHLSKIENDNVEIGVQLDKYLRLLVINLSSDLDIALKAFLDMLPTIQDTRQPHCKMININPADLRQYQQPDHAHA